MQNIPDNTDINLWFEDDLFCQVNFWFVINLLSKSHQNNQFFLIRPKSHSQYGFGGLAPKVLRRHDFIGTVSVISCNDNYFEMHYNLCRYGTSSVKVGISRNECISLNLTNGMRVKVTANSWTYSPRKKLYTITNVIRIVKL